MKIISDYYLKDNMVARVNISSYLRFVVYQIYRWLYENGVLEKISFCYEEDKYIVDFAFEVNDLLPYKERLLSLKIPDVEKGVNILFDANLPSCQFCGASTLIENMMTYRSFSNGLITSKCVQCHRCDLLPLPNLVADIRKYRLDNSDKEAIQKYWSLIKVKQSKNVKIGDFDIHYVQFIDGGHTHHLWYGGTVVKITYKGYTFEIRADGDVKAVLTDLNEHLGYVNDKNNIGEFYGCFRNYIKDDQELNDSIWRYESFAAADEDIIPVGKMLNIMYSNSFELVAFDKDNNEIPLNIDSLDSDTIFEAISEVVDFIPELYKEIKEEKNG